MDKKVRNLGTAVLVAVWLALTAFVWFSPAKEQSVTERRKLKQMPELSAVALWDGRFMSDFAQSSLDQFPLRDGFRSIKAVFHRYGLGQRDNHGIYLAQGHFAALDYPVDELSVARATGVFGKVYEQYLRDSGCTVFMAVVPDKGYYLAQENGYPAMDYDKLFSQVRQQMPWATHVDLTDCLTLEDYYRTDTHWRQENLLPVAQKLAGALGVSAPEESRFTAVKQDRPFYGVYYGQAAVPAAPDGLYLMENEIINGCQVYDFESGKYAPVYDKSKLDAQDLYEVYLSGPRSLLTVENPNATTDRELIVFRDSFAGSLVPLLLQDYRTVTLVDLRYVQSAALEQYLTFRGQDVLFLYSTMVLNDSATIK